MRGDQKPKENFLSERILLKRAYTVAFAEQSFTNEGAGIRGSSSRRVSSSLRRAL